MDELVDGTTVVVHLLYIDTAGFEQEKVSLRARMHTNRETFLTWDPLPYNEYYLQKSGDPNRGWTFIAKFGALSAPQFLDGTANNTMHRHGYEYYRLVAPSESKMSETANVYGSADPYGSEIARRHGILLQHGRSGNPCWAFIRMRQGIRCPECWDEILQQRTRADCPVCHATGYLTGYYDPHQIYVSFGTEDNQLEVELDGPKNPHATIQGWTTNYPVLSSGDVVVEEVNNALWVVVGASFRTHKRSVTKQDLVLERSVGDDIIWELLKRIPGGAP